MIIFDTWRVLEIIINDQVNDDIDSKGTGPLKHSYSSLAGWSISLVLGAVTSLFIYQRHCKNTQR